MEKHFRFLSVSFWGYKQYYSMPIICLLVERHKEHFTVWIHPILIFLAKYFLIKHNGEREDEKLGKSCFQKDAKVVQVSDRRCAFLPCRQVPYNFFNNSLIINKATTGRCCQFTPSPSDCSLTFRTGNTRSVDRRYFFNSRAECLPSGPFSEIKRREKGYLCFYCTSTVGIQYLALIMFCVLKNLLTQSLS